MVALTIDILRPLKDVQVQEGENFKLQEDNPK